MALHEEECPRQPEKDRERGERERQREKWVRDNETKETERSPWEYSGLGYASPCS